MYLPPELVYIRSMCQDSGVGGHGGPEGKRGKRRRVETRAESIAKSRAAWREKVRGLPKGETSRIFLRGETSEVKKKGKKTVVEVKLRPQHQNGWKANDGLCDWRCVFEYEPRRGDAFGDAKLAALVEFAKSRSVVRATIASGASRNVVVGWRKNDEQFERAWRDIWETAIDWLEDSAFVRSVRGYREPIYQMGRLVGHRRVHHPNLTMFMLQRNRRDKYLDKDVSPDQVQRVADLALSARKAIAELSARTQRTADGVKPPKSVVDAAGPAAVDNSARAKPSPRKGAGR